MRIVKLHECPSLIDECCSLLNQEWPRSKTARIHSLSKSSDCFPMCLCLIDDGFNQMIDYSDLTSNHKDKPVGQLIGHVKVSKGSLEGEAYIESLIICKSRRGQGLGSQFMFSIEQLLKSIGFTSVTLHTIDALSFYNKLGYSVVKTIEALGPASSMITGYVNTTNKVTPKINTKQLPKNANDEPGRSSIACLSQTPLPPPPLPPPSISTNRPVIKQEKIVMNKRLT